MPTQLVDLLPALSSLDRADKLKAMSFLICELAKEEDIRLSPIETYPIWTPYNSNEAAQTLLDALEGKAGSHG